MSANKLAWVTPWVSLALVSTSASIDLPVDDHTPAIAASVQGAIPPTAIAGGETEGQTSNTLTTTAATELDLQQLTVAWTGDPATALCPTQPLRWQSLIPQQLPRDFSHQMVQVDVSVRDQLKYLMQALMLDTSPQQSLVEVTTDNRTPILTELPRDIWHVWQQLYTSVTTTLNPQAQIYYLWVNGRLILKSADLEWIKSIAISLEPVLTSTEFDPTQIVPVQIGDHRPAIQVSEALVIPLDQVIAEETKNRDLIAIEGTNHLRESFGIAPLTLVEAQQHLYRLLASEALPFAGIASWYGPQFHGQLTANGEIYDQEAFTAAHPSLPFNTYLKVTNLDSQQSVILRINDRGPFVAPRTLDFSRGAARCLESKQTGVVPYEAEILLNAS